MAEGRKFDAGKQRWSLVPWHGLEAVGRVLEFGAQKYGADNWRLVDGAERRYWDAAMRHMIAFGKGEDLDKETGESHLAHAVCCLLFVLELAASDEDA